MDCFSQDWSSDNNWLVPPVHLIMRTIKHMLYCRANGTLIAPRWPTSAYWTMIFDDNMGYKNHVNDVIEFETCLIFCKMVLPTVAFSEERNLRGLCCP